MMEETSLEEVGSEMNYQVLVVHLKAYSYR